MTDFIVILYYDWFGALEFRFRGLARNGGSCQGVLTMELRLDILKVMKLVFVTVEIKRILNLKHLLFLQ